MSMFRIQFFTGFRIPDYTGFPKPCWNSGIPVASLLYILQWHSSTHSSHPKTIRYFICYLLEPLQVIYPSTNSVSIFISVPYLISLIFFPSKAKWKMFLFWYFFIFIWYWLKINSTNKLNFRLFTGVQGGMTMNMEGLWNVFSGENHIDQN